MRWYLVCMVVCIGLWPALSQAQYEYRLITLPFAGAQQATVTGYVAGEISGTYLDARGQQHGFTEFCSGEITPLINVVARKRSTTASAGWYLAPTQQVTGWLLHDGTFTPIPGPRDAQNRLPIMTELLDVNDTPVAVGAYRSADGRHHGLRYSLNPETFTTLDAPEAVHTTLLQISNQGWILARSENAQDQTTYWVWDNGTFTPLALPDVPLLSLVGRLDDGRLIGNSGPNGFIAQGDAVTLIRVPDSTVTQIVSHTAEGVLLGRVVHAEGELLIERGLLALPEGMADPCAVAREGAPQECPPRKARHHRRHH